MKRTVCVWTLFLAAASLGPAAPQKTAPAAGGSLTLSGAWALYPLAVRWQEEFEKSHPGVNIDVQAGGAGKGVADALAGVADIGMVSREIFPAEFEKGAVAVAVAKDAVIATISRKNPHLAEILRRGLKKEDLAGVWIRKTARSWEDLIGRTGRTPVHVYTRSDACGAAEMWAKFTGDKKQEDLLGVGVNADPGLLEAVLKDPLGIGYNNLGYAFDNASGLPVPGAAVLPIDQNGNGTADPDELIDTKAKAMEMVAAGKYPSPPARPLNLVTNGKPGGVVQAFIEWVLADGQQFVGEAGYVKLAQDVLDAALQKVR
jgi:phosphate transport system substrate-binding protein